MKIKKLEIRPEIYSILFMLYILLAFNTVFFEKVYHLTSLTMTIGTFLVIWLIGSLGGLILFWPKSTKLLSCLFLIISASVFYFVKTYNAFIDDEMLRNALQTNWQETSDLLSVAWFLYVLILGIFPCLMLCFLKIKHRLSWGKNIGLALGCILIAGTIIFANFQTVAPFVRNNKHLKYQLIPVNYVGAVSSFVKKYYRHHHAFEKIAEDAHFEKYWHNNKKNLIVFVVGETARADKFSFNGYQRPTNEPLQEFMPDIINFSHATSCGTSTAVSLPCMFSKETRQGFKSGSMEYTENLLDVFQRSGYHAVWIENNSDCKNLCTRIKTMNPCKDRKKQECLDNVMLPAIDKALPDTPQNSIIVLHQIGSHGPKYYKRYPAEMAPYLPACNTEKLNECTLDELTNVYDNTIHYTSHILAEIIRKIKTFESDYNVIFLYVSDHGESLGENNLYLHSAPYAFAPKEQKEVPFFMWAENKTLQAMNLDKQCLQTASEAPVSHDNIFHTLLGIGGISTQEYEQSLDLTKKCKK